MEMLVLSSFRYSPDGRKIELAQAGTVRDIRADLVDGLKAEGKIADAPAMPQKRTERK